MRVKIIWKHVVQMMQKSMKEFLPYYSYYIIIEFLRCHFVV
jgi:hypothetical protein